VCVEEFTYGADGSIPQMGMTTAGATAVDTLNPFAQTEAETIAWESGIETETCSEGGMNVTSIDNGDYIKVKEVEFGSGATSFEARVASVSGSGAIELRLDSENGTVVGTCAVESTGGQQTWATQSCTVSGATGKHDLFLKFTGGGFKFNWWQFAGPGDPGTGGTGGAGGDGGVAGSGGSEPTGGAGDMGGSGGVSGGGGVGTAGTQAGIGGSSGASEVAGGGGSGVGGGSGTAGGFGGAMAGAGGSEGALGGTPTNAGGASSAGGCSCNTGRRSGNRAALGFFLVFGFFVWRRFGTRLLRYKRSNHA
jgi:hypothetical protein